MVYPQLLILCCIIGSSFGGSCEMGRWEVIVDIPLQFITQILNCSNIEESLYMPSGAPIYRPRLIQIVDSFIEVLSDSYYSKINTTETISLRIKSSRIGSIENSAFKTTLLKISIIQTDIKHLSPVAFNNLPKLKSLQLNHCHLSTINLNGTNSLERLDLSYNNLTEIPTVDCQKLQYLHFTSNKPTDENCTNLLTLNIQMNGVNNITKGHLKKLNKLKYLYAASNPLFKNNDGEIPIDLFQNNLMLNTLDLEDTGITIIRLGTFSSLNNLEYLILERNNLTHLPEGIFSDLNSLIRLIFRTNKIKAIQSRDIFFGLEKLETLDLSNNVLEHIVHDAFSQLTSLLDLFLQNNKLTYLNSSNLPGRLLILNIDENAFKCGSLLNIIKRHKNILSTGTSTNTTNIKRIRCYV